MCELRLSLLSSHIERGFRSLAPLANRKILNLLLPFLLKLFGLILRKLHDSYSLVPKLDSQISE